MPAPVPLHAFRALYSAAVLLGMLALDGGVAEAQRAFSELPSDPSLRVLIEETLAQLPEIKGASAAVRAEEARVPQAGALPDPVLTVGLQNDGFRSYEVGRAETSWWRVELNQPLPWPGKRALRGEVARLGVERVRAYVGRMRLNAEASVRRAYLELLLARDRLDLLDEVSALWAKSVQVARERYQTGLSAQSDVFRAELEVFRLQQRRLGLVAEERQAVQTLNRFRSHGLEEPVGTSTHVVDLALPAPLPLPQALDRAEAMSPELSAARLGGAQADKQVAASERERLPDFSVGAGIMPRGGLPPMWSASLSMGLPVWARQKQAAAVRESRARADASAHDVAVVAQQLKQGVAARSAALEAARAVIHVYTDGLLAQSATTVESTLAQYQVGKVSFASVLEANIGYLNDREGYLLAAAEAQRIAIADAELALDARPPGSPSAVGNRMGGASSPAPAPTAPASAM